MGHAREEDATREDRSRNSYLMLRRIIGVLGMILPLVLLIWGFALCGCGRIEDSISDYYGLRARDGLVGVLFTIAWFLFTYQGYERRDNVAGHLGCLFALGVALFPNSGASWEKAVHFTSAAGFFLVLFFFSYYLFTKTGPTGVMTRQKRWRNRVYRTCGVAILICIGLIGLYHVLPLNESLAAIKPVFWLESMALWAFGFSWLVKGETLWRDR